MNKIEWKKEKNDNKKDKNQKPLEMFRNSSWETGIEKKRNGNN